MFGWFYGVLVEMACTFWVITIIMFMGGKAVRWLVLLFVMRGWFLEGGFGGDLLDVAV